MAYMSQERKKALAPAIMAAVKKYGLKGSLSVQHHSGLCLTLAEGAVDFFADRANVYGSPDTTSKYIQVNTHRYDRHFTGQSLAFLSEVVPLMHVGNHDRSDSMTDYFDVGWYVYVYVGKWDKPYRYTGPVVNKLADAMVLAALRDCCLAG